MKNSYGAEWGEETIADKKKYTIERGERLEDEAQGMTIKLRVVYRILLKSVFTKKVLSQVGYLI